MQPQHHPGTKDRTRHRIFRLGIQAKVILILSITLLVALTLSGWLALQSQKKDILQESNLRGAELAHFVANALTNDVVSYDYHAIELLLQETVKNKDIIYAKVLSPKGNIMAEVGKKSTDDAKVVTFTEDIRVDSEVVGKLFLGLSEERIAAATRQRGSKLIRQELVTILLIALVGFLTISYIIIRPITAISRAMGMANNAMEEDGEKLTDRSSELPHLHISGEVTDEAATPETNRDVLMNGTPVLVRDEIGDLARTFVRLQDRTNHAMNNLRKSETKNRSLVEAIPDIIFRLNRNGLCLDCKIPKDSQPGLVPENLAGKHIGETLPLEVSASILKYLDLALSTGKVQVFYYRQNVNDLDLSYEARINVSADNEAVVILRDMTQHRLMEEKIEFLAHYDSLTNLPNRTLFKQRADDAINHAKILNSSIAVMIMDLNNFKIINDTLGHSAGDLLLQEVSERLQRWMRTSDYISRQPIGDKNQPISRHGGDKFSILLTHIPSESKAGRAAQRVLEMLSAPFRISDKEIVVSASIGIAMYPADGADEETLLKNAEAAMYHAKSQGRANYRFYNQSMNAAYATRLAMENHLRKALELGELHLYYQPQIDIRSGRVIGMESLMRWNNPELGFVSPAEFIPLAEDTALIIPLGIWALHTACAQNAAWQRQGLPPMRVAVNVSGIQFRQPGLASTVRQALKKTGLDPKYLELELTEGVILRNDERVINTLKELKSLGVHLSIDDFGTGYSSLSYLKRFPIDTLKIDRSFVNGITTNDDEAAIVTAIIAMAHSLKLDVVAEGVETQAQLDFLSNGSCDLAQGYLFSPAVPAGKFPETLQCGEINSTRTPLVKTS
ncbi:MAG: putative bifunctional diguanylate cyclase/phosphodiesterase [Sulfuricaulis sp.]